MSYAKELWKHLDKAPTGVGFNPDNLTSRLVHQYSLVNGARFVLPDMGLLMDDPQARGLDLETPLHLPFDTMVLQYTTSEWAKLDSTKFMSSSKAVVIASTDLTLIKSIKSAPGWFEHFKPILVSSWVFLVKEHRWAKAASFLMPTVNWNAGRYPDGSVKHCVFPIESQGKQIINLAEVSVTYGTGEVTTPLGLESIIELLNILACSNVKTHKVRTDKPKAGKPPLPFSETWELTIDPPKVKVKKGEIAGCPIIDRRSPREHVRMGHIRTYESGLKIWINAAIIAKGSVGKITKTYKVKKA